MREIIVAIADDGFKVGEKVIAFNWFEKVRPFRFGTYIKKFSQEDVLLEGEMSRRIDTPTKREYNIGEYKVVKLLAGYAQIQIWDRQDKELI